MQVERKAVEAGLSVFEAMSTPPSPAPYPSILSTGEFPSSLVLLGCAPGEVLSHQVLSLTYLTNKVRSIS